MVGQVGEADDGDGRDDGDQFGAVGAICEAGHDVGAPYLRCHGLRGCCECRGCGGFRRSRSMAYTSREEAGWKVRR